MANLIVKRYCLIWALVSSSNIWAQTFIFSERITATVSYNLDSACHYNESDSAFIVFQKGFDGKIAVYQDDSLLGKIEGHYSRNLEMIPFVFKFKRSEPDYIEILYNEKEKLKFYFNSNYGIAYINKILSNNLTGPRWGIKFDNCFYPARR